MSAISPRRAHLWLLLGTLGAASYGGLLVLFTLVQSRGEAAGHAYRPADFSAVPIEFVAVHDLRFDGRTWRAEPAGAINPPESPHRHRF